VELAKQFPSETAAWWSARQRCYDPNNQNFRFYGGKKIAMCKRWKSFAVFLRDMGTRQPGTYLARIDKAGNYEPGNCVWAPGPAHRPRR